LKILFNTNAIGFIVTNGAALWKGAISPPDGSNTNKAKYYYALPAVYFIVLLLQVLTNFLLIGPLKLISWLLNPIFELLNLINVIFITILPLWHAVSLKDLIKASEDALADTVKLYEEGKSLVTEDTTSASD